MLPVSPGMVIFVTDKNILLFEPGITEIKSQIYKNKVVNENKVIISSE